MKITNKMGLPPAIVAAVKNDPYDSEGSISATTLIQPPQIIGLTHLHHDELEEDASDRIWALFGQSVHHIIERANATEMILGNQVGDSCDRLCDELIEERLFSVIGGELVSGKFDRVSIKDATLSDYKVTSVWTKIFGPRPEWEEQLNICAQLCRNNGIAINKLEIIAIYRDYRDTEALRTDGYPRSVIEAIPVDVWPETRCMEFIRERVDAYKKAISGEWRPCTDEERWPKPTTYAVMKVGRQSAVRVFDRRLEAEDYMDQHQDGKLSVVVRPGSARRCERYCPVADLCPQYQATLK